MDGLLCAKAPNPSHKMKATIKFMSSLFKTMAALLIIAVAVVNTETTYAASKRSAQTASNRQKAKAPKKADTTGLLKMVERNTPGFAGKIVFQVKPDSPTKIIGAGNKVRIVGATLSECARGYGYYLRHVVHIHLSWNGDRVDDSHLVVPAEEITVPETLPYNFAFNYCTMSYTCAHWDKKRWVRELDRLAMDGYKYVLVTPGLEKVWQGFLKDLNYPASKIQAFIPAPTYAAWWNMGNLEGEGGPISQSLIDSEAELGRFIVRRAKELGLTPVLQGYYGMLPHDFPASGVDGTILQQGQWCGYQRPALLQPTSPGFPKVAALWYKNLHAVYGTKAAAYGGDLFHEGGRPGNTDLTAAAKAVQTAMQTASPGSIWFIQAWANNPHPKLLAGTDPEHTVILYLNKNMSEKNPAHPNYQGRPHVWCELSNFGGNHGLFGGFGLVMNLSGNANGASGFGLLSEGLETNPLFYALFVERINNRGVINLDEFARDYCLARYGSDDPDLIAYVKVLAESVYRPDKIREGCLENIQAAHPSLQATKVSTWSNDAEYYAPAKVVEAGRHLLAAGKRIGAPLTSLPTYRYDLADICRQVLADRARKHLKLARKAFEAKDIDAFRRESAAFIKTIDDSARVLSTCPDFLLGNYLAGARNRAKSSTDKRQMERNVRTLITTWRPGRISLLNGYANREYAELMSHYYKPRWVAYFKACEATLNGTAGQDAVGTFTSGTAGNNGENVGFRYEQNRKVEAIELAFPTADIPLLTTPKGDIMMIAEEILNAAE